MWFSIKYKGKFSLLPEESREQSTLTYLNLMFYSFNPEEIINNLAASSSVISFLWF
jgi:hypothetical protein